MPINKVTRTTSQQVPSGYVLGRRSKGNGPVELLNLTDLQAIGVASKAQAGSGGTHGFGFSISGRPGAGQVIGIAVYAKTMTFTSAASGDSVVANVAAHASAVFNMTVGGASVGTITFLAGHAVAAVAWSGGQYQLAANTQMKLVAPASQDSALSDISGQVIGVQG